ncbi:MAG: hypothetical protein AB1489_17940 [Acidobacteriota bacterium]
MGRTSNNRYLLGEMTGVEKSQFEEQYFTNNDSFEMLLIAEEELIDEYIRGTLPQEKQQQFEQHFLSYPQHKQRVEFARTLMEWVSRQKWRWRY